MTKIMFYVGEARVFDKEVAQAKSSVSPARDDRFCEKVVFYVGEMRDAGQVKSNVWLARDESV